MKTHTHCPNSEASLFESTKEYPSRTNTTRGLIPLKQTAITPEGPAHLKPTQPPEERPQPEHLPLRGSVTNTTPFIPYQHHQQSPPGPQPSRQGASRLTAARAGLTPPPAPLTAPRTGREGKGRHRDRPLSSVTSADGAFPRAA